jgi:hypothetical protein
VNKPFEDATGEVEWDHVLVEKGANRRVGMSYSALIRWGGLAAMLGGTLWVIATLIHAAKPRGCIAEECAFRPMRETGALGGVLTLLSVLLLVVGAVGLVILVRSGGRFGSVGKAGVLIGAVGAALMVIATLIQAIFFGGDFPLMPYFVVPGLLALVVGFLLVGIAILRSGVLPRWVAVLVIVGALAMLGANEQTARVLLMVPFGVASVAVGYVLWSGAGAPTGRAAARVR